MNSGTMWELHKLPVLEQSLQIIAHSSLAIRFSFMAELLSIRLYIGRISNSTVVSA